MKDFIETKNKIIRLFSNRIGFTEEYVDAITATYLYLDENFPNPIDEKEIVDVSNFTLQGVTIGERSLANIYINRIFNNVKLVENHKYIDEYDSNGIKVDTVNRYSPIDKKVILCQERLDDRIDLYKYLGYSNKQNETLNEKLRAKIITHEFIHAASDNGESVGFANAIDNSNERLKIIKKYYPEGLMGGVATSSYLEEIITEILALEIVGSNNPTQKGNNFIAYNTRNRDSSNNPLNPIGEYMIRALPDIVKGKFTSGISYLKDLHKSFGFDNRENFIYTFDLYLRTLASKASNVSEEEVNDIEGIYNFFQCNLLDVYQNNNKLDSKENVIKSCKDFTAFNLFAIRVNGQISNELKIKLQKFKEKITVAANAYNVDLKEIYNNEKERLTGKKELDKKEFDNPYAFLNESINSNIKR